MRCQVGRDRASSGLRSDECPRVLVEGTPGLWHDPFVGIYTYVGDNRRPGHQLHDTPRQGNRIFADAFARTHGTRDERSRAHPCS